MADPLLPMTLGVGASLVKVLLQANGYATEANLVGVAREGCGILSRWKKQGGNADSQLAKQIDEILAEKTRGMYEECRGQGIDEERLGGVVTEVEILFNKFVGNDELLLLAVNNPTSFSEVLQDYIGRRRKNIESRLEPYFDKLVEATLDEYLKLAPWSPKFQIEALKYLGNKLDEILENTAKSLKNEETIIDEMGSVKGAMNDIRDKFVAMLDSRFIPMLEPFTFGVRPDVADSYYIEREEQVRLRNLVKEGPRLRVVLVGMRGCGKSQLASSLARWCEKQEWGLVAWINAASRESTKSDLVELAQRLPIDRSDKPTQDQLINRCLDYFKSANATGRLIIFDNVKDINHLTGLVPRGDGLRVVATTTNKRGWRQQSWKVLELGVFSHKDSIECLLRITDSKDRKAADAIAQKLGDLPLAIVQAGATACEEYWTLKQYISRLEHYSSGRVIKRVPGDSYTENVSKALFKAVDVALKNLGGDEREVARRQLGGLAVLAQSGVPTRWIDPLSPDAYNADPEESIPDIADENAHNALTRLVSMSVVQQSADKAKSITMLHRLQAQVLRENWGAGKTATREEAFDAALEILGRTKYEQLPSNNGDARRREASDLIAQLKAIAIQDYSRFLFEREQVRGYLNRAFNYADDLGLVYEAVELDVAVEDVLGPDHPDTLKSRDSLSGAYESAGRLAEAIELFERVLAERERVLGVDHPDTLNTRDSLAGAYESAGRLAEAIDAWEELLLDCQRVLGADHPVTLTVLNNLAVAYYSVGRFGEAIELFERVLAERERVLGVDHPDTLNTRNNLAGAYKSVGRFGEAIELFEQVLAERERVLGADHPDTLNTRNNLAGAYYSVGRLAEVLDAWEELLLDCQRVLGPDHPVTLAVLNNLAVAYKSVGRFGEAIELFEQVLAERKRLLGADHPDTLNTRNNLAGAYDSAGHLAEAIDAWEELLPDCQRVLGLEHPLTKLVQKNLEAAKREMNPPDMPSPETGED